MLEPLGNLGTCVKIDVYRKLFSLLYLHPCYGKFLVQYRHNSCLFLFVDSDGRDNSDSTTTAKLKHKNVYKQILLSLDVNYVNIKLLHLLQ